jgi:hypothetical protein
MKGKFHVVVTREGDDYVARCSEVADAVAYGSSKEDVLKRMEAIHTEKFRPDDGSDDGTAPTPHPVSPSPRGPISPREESHEKPEA